MYYANLGLLMIFCSQYPRFSILIKIIIMSLSLSCSENHGIYRKISKSEQKKMVNRVDYSTTRTRLRAQLPKMDRLHVLHAVFYYRASLIDL
jgi:hypothetical protein